MIISTPGTVHVHGACMACAHGMCIVQNVCMARVWHVHGTYGMCMVPYGMCIACACASHVHRMCMWCRSSLDAWHGREGAGARSVGIEVARREALRTKVIGVVRMRVVRVRVVCVRVVCAAG